MRQPIKAPGGSWGNRLASTSKPPAAFGRSADESADDLRRRACCTSGVRTSLARLADMTPRLLRDPAVLLATCGGIGFVGIAPGTFGAAVGLVIALAVMPLDPLGEMIVVAGLCLAGIPICTRAAARLGGHDPSAVVLDEAAAMPLVLLAVPPDARSLPVLGVAFVLFRIFDITKPFPCRRLERLPAGLGIMADDWAAAGWAAACLVVARRLGWV